MSPEHARSSTEALVTPRLYPALISILMVVCLHEFCSQAQVFRVLGTGEPGVPLLINGNFESATNGKPEKWVAAPNGFKWIAGEGRNASQGLDCENRESKESTGASQTLSLNRTNALPLMVSGWSKARDVSGSSDSGYSLYVDIIYQDGTPLWGQTADFKTGTHDWQFRHFTIFPEKPVKTLTLHCLFRGHTGAVAFDDVSVEELGRGTSSILFDGVPIAIGETDHVGGKSPGPSKLRTKDGLQLKLRQNRVESLKIGGAELAAPAPSGFMARDVSTNSDVFSFGSNGECDPLKLDVQAHWLAEKNCIRARGRVSDRSKKDRAITLYFALPIDASGWSWGEDIRRQQKIGGHQEFRNTVPVGCGASGTMSLYPLACVYSEKHGLALGMDMDKPAQYRLAYNAGTKQLYIAWDFGLVPETEHFPSSAEFSFVLFRFDPQWGFRSAFENFTHIFPAAFEVRSHDQGIWMPFTDVSKVEGWQDFGFKYHEGDNNVAWDNGHGVLSFRYTEPMTWWMSMPKSTPRTETNALQIRDQLAAEANARSRRMAQVSKSAAMYDDSGHPALSFRDTPWCDGAVWSLNPNPFLPAPGEEPNAATVYWNPSIKEKLYHAAQPLAPDKTGTLDGEYLDSLEGYVTTDLNFRREHFRHSTVPLTFSSDTFKPALWKGLAVYEFTRWLSEDVHRMGKLMFANGVPYRLTFLCPWLDVMGTETDWLRDGKYVAPNDSQLALWRTMSAGKPYLLLMNTDYEAFKPEFVERYFQQSLFYGMLPSMFSHNAADNPYWRNPKWYNRDRELFKKYIPLIKQVAEAGWQPVTLATSSNPRVLIERFGPDKRGTVFLTCLNNSAEPQTAPVRLDRGFFGHTHSNLVTQLLSQTQLPLTNNLNLKLMPHVVEVLRFQEVPGRAVTGKDP